MFKTHLALARGRSHLVISGRRRVVVRVDELDEFAVVVKVGTNKAVVVGELDGLDLGHLEGSRRKGELSGRIVS